MLIQHNGCLEAAGDIKQTLWKALQLSATCRLKEMKGKKPGRSYKIEIRSLIKAREATVAIARF